MPVPLPVVLVAAAVLVLVVWSVRVDRRRRARLAELLATMGFRPMSPDPRDADALMGLYRHGVAQGRRIRLENVHGCDVPGGRRYVFDVRVPGQKRSLLASNVVGLVRRGAGLPAMEVRTLGEQAAGMPEWMKSMIGNLLGPGRPVPFDDSPEFSRRFTVFAPAEAEAAVRRVLTPQVRQALLGFRFLSLETGGDALALEANLVEGPNRGDEQGALRALIQESERVARVLEPEPEAELAP